MEVRIEINDELLKRLREAANHRGTTIMALVEDAFRLELAKVSDHSGTRAGEPGLTGWNGLDFLTQITNMAEVDKTTAGENRKNLPYRVPTFKIGGLLVDISDRNKLYEAMGGDEIYMSPQRKDPQD